MEDKFNEVLLSLVKGKKIRGILSINILLDASIKLLELFYYLMVLFSKKNKHIQIEEADVNETIFLIEGFIIVYLDSYQEYLFNADLVNKKPI